MATIKKPTQNAITTNEERPKLEASQNSIYRDTKNHKTTTNKKQQSYAIRTITESPQSRQT